MTLAESIRQHVQNKYMKPARLNGDSMVKIRAIDVHTALGLKNRYPAVCSALDAQKFLSEANVMLINRHGPNQGNSVEWTFGL